LVAITKWILGAMRGYSIKIIIKSNKSLVERIEELKLEIKLLNDEINKVLKEKRG
jgi:uncharacterized protein (UPF0335 family)